MQNNVPKSWLFHNWICQLVCFGALCACVVRAQSKTGHIQCAHYFLRGFSFCGSLSESRRVTKNFEIMYSGFVWFFLVIECMYVFVPVYMRCCCCCCWLVCFFFFIFIIDFCCCLFSFPFIDKAESGCGISDARTIWFRCSYRINRHDNRPNHQLNNAVHIRNNALTFDSISNIELGSEVICLCYSVTPFNDNNVFWKWMAIEVRFVLCF